MTADLYFFTYGTLQEGYPNHGGHASLLGPSLGRYRTVELHPLIVVREPACPNPGCRFEHRMCALLREPGNGHKVEGDVYRVGPEAIQALDALESYDPGNETGCTYLRRTVQAEPIKSDGPAVACQIYFIADGSPYQNLVERDRAEIVAHFTREMATGRLKQCCRETPDHKGPHLRTDPFA